MPHPGALAGSVLRLAMSAFVANAAFAGPAYRSVMCALGHKRTFGDV